MLGDTIAAVSTAMGESGVGIIRLSGPDSLGILEQVFEPVNKERFGYAKGYRMYYGHIKDPDNDCIIDEVLVSIMRSPHSFTGEDVVEINCHGGLIAQRSILNLVLRNGARLAEAGEFSKRAFINGRMDLAQAEAVIDLIQAKTSLSAAAALEQLRGKLSLEVIDCRNKLLVFIAQIEASIDFPEDVLEAVNFNQLASQLESVHDKLSQLLSTAERGRILRDGLNTAIIGQPNVGKSSLLNALLRENRAIVTDIPGTTRDILEEYINVKGVPLKIIDTAGIRETQDLVEKLGVERALETLNRSDIVLFVLDAGSPLSDSEKDLLSRIPANRLIIVINKIDLTLEKKEILHLPTFYISALKGIGISELEDGIIEIAAGHASAETPLISNTRHINALDRAAVKLKDAINSLRQLVPLDLISIDIRAAWEILGEVTGESVNEDILDEIFSRFCIGK